MKLKLNVGDWATIALFALGTVLGCYAQARRELPAAASTTTANQSSSARTAVAAVGLE